MDLKYITWYGHSSFKFIDQVSGSIIYYIDPYNFSSSLSLEKADIIFVTHIHSDHLSPPDIQKIVKEDTVFVAPGDCLAQIDLPNEKNAVVPNMNYEIKNVKFQTVPAYNIHPERLYAHPKANNWVGYIFTINNQRVYHAGDTDFIPEMKNLGLLDVAMLPIGGSKFAMTVEEAIEAANTIKAKVTVPIHYRKLLGPDYPKTEAQFKKGVTQSEVIIMEEVS